MYIVHITQLYLFSGLSHIVQNVIILSSSQYKCANTADLMKWTKLVNQDVIVPNIDNVCKLFSEL